MNKHLKLKKKDRAYISRAMSLFTQLGMQVVVILVGSIVAGNYLDNRFGTGPVIMLVFAALGAVTAFRSIYRTAMGAVAPEDKKIGNKEDADD